jgi:hypothetical protein
VEGVLAITTLIRSLEDLVVVDVATEVEEVVVLGVLEHLLAQIMVDQ